MLNLNPSFSVSLLIVLGFNWLLLQVSSWFVSHLWIKVFSITKDLCTLDSPIWALLILSFVKHDAYYPVVIMMSLVTLFPCLSLSKWWYDHHKNKRHNNNTHIHTHTIGRISCQQPTKVPPGPNYKDSSSSSPSPPSNDRTYTHSSSLRWLFSPVRWGSISSIISPSLFSNSNRSGWK